MRGSNSSVIAKSDAVANDPSRGIICVIPDYTIAIPSGWVYSRGVNNNSRVYLWEDSRRRVENSCNDSKSRCYNRACIWNILFIRLAIFTNII